VHCAAHLCIHDHDDHICSAGGSLRSLHADLFHHVTGLTYACCVQQGQGHAAHLQAGVEAHQAAVHGTYTDMFTLGLGIDGSADEAVPCMPACSSALCQRLVKCGNKGSTHRSLDGDSTVVRAVVRAEGVAYGRA
jgi:hypothetical protein